MSTHPLNSTPAPPCLSCPLPCCPGHVPTLVITLHTPCGTQWCLSSQQTGQTEKKDPIFLHLVLPGPSMQPAYHQCSGLTQQTKPNKDQQQRCCRTVAEIHPHSQEVVSLNVSSFILHMKLSETTSNSHVRRAVPSAGRPARIRPAELTASAADRAGRGRESRPGPTPSCQAEGNQRPAQITSRDAEGNI